MSSDSVLPYDIILLILASDIVGENEDTNLLKKLALVSHSFLQICDCYPPPSSDNDDELLLSILPKLLRKISRLNYLKIDASGSSGSDWKLLNFSLRSAFLHLMHLPTINHIDLSFIGNLPLSSLSLSVNLHRLDLFRLACFDYFDQHGENGSFEIVQSMTTPNIREFYTTGFGLPTTELLHVKRQYGLPSFNFVELSMSFVVFKDERSIRYLLENAKLLQKLHLSAGRYQTLVGLISPCARTLKILDLTVFLNQIDVPPLAGICEELEAIAGQNMLETLSFEIQVDRVRRDDFMGSIIQKVEEVVVRGTGETWVVCVKTGFL
jgi:hypothetical protein